MLRCVKYITWILFVTSRSDRLPRLPQKACGGRVVQWCWINFHCRGVLPIWIKVGQGPTVLVECAGGRCLDMFVSHLSFFTSFFLSLEDGPTLQYCRKGLLNPKQPTNQPTASKSLLCQSQIELFSFYMVAYFTKFASFYDIVSV